MIRVHVICEGQTEETFVKELLNDFFSPKGIFLLPSLIGKPGHKGGNISFDRLFVDVQNFLLSDKTAYCTTFLDYYGLSNNFPGKMRAKDLPFVEEKARAVGDDLSQALEERLGTNVRRFIPFIQMHEFEALLFSDPASFAQGIYYPELADGTPVQA